MGVAKNQNCHHVAENVLQVSEVHGEGRENQRETEREQELHQQRDRKPRQLRQLDRRVEINEERYQDRQAQEKMHEVREHRHDRQNLGREHHFLDEIASRDQDARRFQQRRRKPRPRQKPAEKEQRVVVDLAGRGHHVGEHERVDQQQQQRVDERPEKAENRASVPGLQFSGDQALDEPAIARKLTQVIEHEDTSKPWRAAAWRRRAAYSLHARAGSRGDLEPDDRLHEGDLRPLEVDVGRRFRDALFGAALRRLGPRDVDLFRTLGDFGKDGDAIGQHLGKPERDREGRYFSLPLRYHNSPAFSIASSGVCPGSTPK